MRGRSYTARGGAFFNCPQLRVCVQSGGYISRILIYFEVTLLTLVKNLHWTQLLRPKQWIKNGFVYAPLIFSGRLATLSGVYDVSLVALFFCLASSIAYIINDICDVSYDRLHPKKCMRPIASGSVSVSGALTLLALLGLLLSVGLTFKPSVSVPIGVYLGLALAYSFYLKHQPVVDIFVIALCFVVRLYAGASVLEITLSNWMFITTFSLALYLASIKRHQEILQSGEAGRVVLQAYTPELIERYATISAVGAAFFYSLFVLTANQKLVLTIPLVLFGLYRYWYIADILGEGESPTDALLKDWQILLTVTSWVMVCIWYSL